MSISERERQASLELIQAANREMAERAKAPGWYHWALGALVGGSAAALALPIAWQAACFVVYLAGLGLLVRAYRRHTGMWIPGYRAGRTRWVAFGGAAVVTALLLGAIWLARATGLHGIYAGAGVLLGLFTVALGYGWERAYRRDLGVDGA